MFKPCVVIPVYNHEQAIGRVVQGVLAQKLPCIVVDDGSGRECAGVLDALAAAAPGKNYLDSPSGQSRQRQRRVDGRSLRGAGGLQPRPADRCGRPAPGRRHCALFRTSSGSSRGVDRRLS